MDGNSLTVFRIRQAYKVYAKIIDEKVGSVFQR